MHSADEHVGTLPKGCFPANVGAPASVFELLQLPTNVLEVCKQLQCATKQCTACCFVRQCQVVRSLVCRLVQPCLSEALWPCICLRATSCSVDSWCRS